jgi:subtilisin-like proprotein convertase family protein
MQRPRLWAAALAAAGLTCATQAQTDTVTHLYETCTPSLGTCGSVPIPDFPGPAATLNLLVPDDGNGTLIQRVTAHIWIQHTYQGDLLVELINPAGTVVRLLNRPGGGSFSANDFGGFYTRPAPCSNSAFEAMHFLDDASACPLFPVTATIYDTPFVAAPGLDEGGAGSDQCTSLFCGARTYHPIDPLSGFAGSSKVGTWTLRVTDMAAVDTGSIRYLGLSITTVAQGTAVITSPAPFGLVCNPTVVTGTASDPSGSIQGYVVEYSTSLSGPWTLIASSTTPVVGGTLATWNTTGASEGYNFLRLTVLNNDGITSQFAEPVYVDQSFTGISIRSPLNNAIVGGNVCPDGTITDPSFVNYRIEFAPPPFTTFTAVDPGTPVYTTPIINDPLGTWNTASGPTAVPDGDYRMRFTGTDACGHVGIVNRDVIVDNTPPVAFISQPSGCGYLCGPVQVIGTVTDAHLAGWVLQYTGGSTHTWVNIASGSAPVVNGVLGVWNTGALPRCAYTLRLVASDQASVNCGTTSNSTEYEVSVNVGAYANCDGSTSAPVLNVNDFICFQSQFAAGAGCPQ